MTGLYKYPYPSSELEAEHPFVELDFDRLTEDEMRRRATAMYERLDKRRSVRMFSPDRVPRELIELAIRTASTAPSGAHKQPWRFVAVSSPQTKRAIRRAAEEEERINYLENRMNQEWQDALGPLGTDHHKEFLEIAPWVVVLFEQRFELLDDGTRKKNYYVKESCGIAAGLFVAALHEMGLVTLTHTPSPMAFLTRLLNRPTNERPFVLFPIGYPIDGAKVPDISRKPLEEVAVFVAGDTVET